MHPIPRFAERLNKNCKQDFTGGLNTACHDFLETVSKYFHLFHPVCSAQVQQLGLREQEYGASLIV